ncbi:MAG: type II toxin-antitoxin system VapC family toxin [Candidatus Binatia bacterium]
MLDTDISSYIIKQRPPTVLVRFQQVPRNELCISVITLAELLYGIELANSKTLNREVVDGYTSRLSIVPWSVGAAEQYGKLCALLKRQGQPIGVMDFLIAAYARSRGCIVVTNNVHHFSRIPDLVIENWAVEG